MVPQSGALAAWRVARGLVRGARFFPMHNSHISHMHCALPLDGTAWSAALLQITNTSSIKRRTEHIAPHENIRNPPAYFTPRPHARLSAACTTHSTNVHTAQHVKRAPLCSNQNRLERSVRNRRQPAGRAHNWQWRGARRAR
eukprot:scaffold30598_cov60-Phaeocystis_antarctica.AAC.2